MNILQFKKKQKGDDFLPRNCIIMGDGLTATKSLQLLVDCYDVKIDRVMTESQREEILEALRFVVYPILANNIKEIVDTWDQK